MPLPTQSDVHVDAVLTNFALQYNQDPMGFAAESMFSTVPVSSPSGLYVEWSRADLNRNQARKRAGGTESAGIGQRLTRRSYTTEVWALHRDLDDQLLAAADAGLNLEQNAVKLLVNQMRISKEVEFASNFFGTGIWGLDYTGSAAPGVATDFLLWSDPDSNPIKTIRDIKTAVQLKSGGFRPNRMGMGRAVFDALVDHPDFVQRILGSGGPSQPSIVLKQAMAALFEVDDIQIFEAIVNTGKMDPSDVNEEEVNSFIMGNGVLLLYSAGGTVDTQTPTAGIMLKYTGLFGGNADGARIKSFYMEEIESTRTEIEWAYDFKVTGSVLGAFLNTPIAA